VFIFIAPSDVTFSPDLVPPYVANSPTFSSSKPKRILPRPFFDPVDVVLSLRLLILINKHAVKESIGSGVAASVQALGLISISFLGNGSADRMSLSPSAPHGSSRSSHSPQAGDLLLELGVKENVVAPWDLRRRGSAEFKRSVQACKQTCWLVVAKGRLAESAYFTFVYLFQIIDRVSFYFSSWLAEGELFTLDLFKLAVSFLALYLSHQFSFNKLDKGHHALLLRYQLDITDAKVEVRRTVKISL